MKTGDVYKLNKMPIRILMLDDNEVFYDTINKDFSFQCQRFRTLTYYRTTRSFFKTNAEFISSVKLTKKEFEKHRPDLPLRLNCFKEVFWSHEIFQSIDEFSPWIESLGIDLEKLVGLASPEIVIYPSSHSLNPKKPRLLKSDHSQFSAIELLYNCFNLQSEFIRPQKPYFSTPRITGSDQDLRLKGIGIYRSGLKGNIPAYSLGTHLSLLGLAIGKVD